MLFIFILLEVFLKAVWCGRAEGAFRPSLSEHHSIHRRPFFHCQRLQRAATPGSSGEEVEATCALNILRSATSIHKYNVSQRQAVQVSALHVPHQIHAQVLADTHPPSHKFLFMCC